MRNLHQVGRQELPVLPLQAAVPPAQQRVQAKVSGRQGAGRMLNTTYWGRVAEGKCPTCGGQPRPGRRTCGTCAAHTNKKDSQRRQRRRDSNVCYVCDKRPVQKAGTSCDECRAARNAKRAAAKAKVIRCGCGDTQPIITTRPEGSPMPGACPACGQAGRRHIRYAHQTDREAAST